MRLMDHHQLMKYLFVLLISSAASVGYADCPDNPPIMAALNQAYQNLESSKLPSDSHAVTDKLWRLWTQAPDGKSQRLLNRGMLSIRQGNLQAAEAHLSALITYCPGYAEGHNQRALARYLAFDLEGSLVDLARTLSIQPRHLGALSGKGLTHLALGQEAKAEFFLRKALSLNRFMPERGLIPNLGTDL